MNANKGNKILIFRRWAAELDDQLLAGRLQTWYSKASEVMLQPSLRSGVDHRIVIQYNQNFNNELAILCDQYGSDKGEVQPVGHSYPWPSHTYSDYYSMLFGHCRQNVLRVFECGLGTRNPEIPSSMGPDGKPGASLRVWRDYFPNASVFGCDIDRESLFEEERISTNYIDQLDAGSVQEFWKTVGVGDFDLMVDDGLHTFEAGSNLFKNSIEHLATTGIYVIEDVSPADLSRYKKYFGGTGFLVDYVSLYRPNAGLRDNNLVVVRKPN
jgi:hypothetical protein